MPNMGDDAGSKSAARAVRLRRWPTALIMAISWTILLMAAWLEPAASGTGTHQQLGLPPCGLLMATGIPCATCGYTTAFAAAAHGHLLRAFYVQPAGALLALLTAAAAIVALYSLATGMSLRPLGQAVARPRVFILAAAVILAAWIYKIVIAWPPTP